MNDPDTFLYPEYPELKNDEFDRFTMRFADSFLIFDSLKLT
jgi:hypothetical protein